MQIRLFITIALSCLLLAGSVIARPDFKEGFGRKDRMRKELTQEERMHMRKHMKHKQMAREHGREFMRHKGMAREHMRQFRGERFGPMMPPEHRMGPPPFKHFRRGMPFGPEHLGPQMSPEHRMGPPPHMRFRDGKRASRAL